MLTQEKIQKALDLACALIEKNLPEFTHKFQDAASTDLFYKAIENDYWTTGFWTGEIWLAYENTDGENFKEVAMVQVESFHNRIVKKISVDHHDMGFLYSPSCVAAYKLTGSESAKEAAIMAADQLMTRFHEIGGFLQAWGSLDEPGNYRLIIDCLLNLPLLYWATDVTGNDQYRKVALRHTETALNNVIRDDYSTHHTFYFDPETGSPKYGETCQGYSNTSAWARGQAWGVYGLALSYKYTENEHYKRLFDHVLDFYISRLPEDLVPYWDLVFTEGDEPRDSSSAAIVICGLLEMAKFASDEKADYYIALAKKMMASLIDTYAVKDPKISNGLLLHGTYSNQSPYNTCNQYGVDECTSWGDYFYMEALTRMVKDWQIYW